MLEGKIDLFYAMLGNALHVPGVPAAVQTHPAGEPTAAFLL